MNINDQFPSNYLKASDLAGRKIPVTIDRVEVEEIGRQKERRPIVYFVGKEKGLVLNKTNMKMIVRITGSDETDDWKGAIVTLYAAKVEFSGEMVDAIRVDHPPKKKPATASKSDEPKAQAASDTADEPDFNDDDIPF